MPNRRSRNPQGHRKPKTVDAAKAPTNVIPINSAAATSLVPPIPKGLGRRATRAWEDFHRSQVGTITDPADHYALYRWITAVDERERLLKVVRDHPTVEGSQGQPVPNPLAKRLENLETRIERAEVQFGMTPKARADLGVAAGTAAMTAEQLNRMAQEDDGDEDEEAFDGETVDGDAEEIDGFVDADAEAD